MADKINAAGYETKPWWPYVRELMEGGGSVTVEQLNVTENGTYTAEAGKAYSPVVVNVEGGSSDFSTATVTLVNNGTSDVVGINASLAFSENTLGEGAPATSFPSLINQLAPNQSMEVTVILYKGNGVIDPSSNSSYFDMALTGDIEENGPMLIVTGNGTITFTDKT